MRNVAVVAIVAALAGCQSVMGAFTSMKPDYTEVPVDALQEVAATVERAVAEGNRDAQISDQGGIVVETEAIRQAIRTRAARAELLDAFRDTGHVWEKRDGLVAVLRTREYKKLGTRRDRDRNALLVMSENQNRWTIYEGIRKESNLPPRSLAAIQRTFFEARLEVMGKGQKYENESGTVDYIGGKPETKPDEPAE